MQQKQTEEPLDLIWGATNIAREIGVSERRAFYLLERGLIPAEKVGDRWCSSRPVLRERFVKAKQGRAA